MLGVHDLTYRKQYVQEKCPRKQRLLRYDAAYIMSLPAASAIYPPGALAPDPSGKQWHAKERLSRQTDLERRWASSGGLTKIHHMTNNVGTEENISFIYLIFFLLSKVFTSFQALPPPTGRCCGGVALHMASPQGS